MNLFSAQFVLIRVADDCYCELQFQQPCLLMLCQKLHRCQQCHCSSTWPVKTCLHHPDHNNKLLQMAAIHVRGRPEVITVYWEAPIGGSMHTFFLRKVHKLNGSSVLTARPAKPNKHLWNVTALQTSSFSLLSVFISSPNSYQFRLHGLLEASG